MDAANEPPIVVWTTPEIAFGAGMPNCAKTKQHGMRLSLFSPRFAYINLFVKRFGYRLSKPGGLVTVISVGPPRAN